MFVLGLLLTVSVLVLPSISLRYDTRYYCKLYKLTYLDRCWGDSCTTQNCQDRCTRNANCRIVRMKNRRSLLSIRECKFYSRYSYCSTTSGYYNKYKYLIKRDECDPGRDRCVHGRCKLASLTTKYRCTCQTGWAGKNCDIRPCDTNSTSYRPCGAGECVVDWSLLNGYKCNCVKDRVFDGLSCVEELSSDVPVFWIVIGALVPLVIILVLCVLVYKKCRSRGGGGRPPQQQQVLMTQPPQAYPAYQAAPAPYQQQYAPPPAAAPGAQPFQAPPPQYPAGYPPPSAAYPPPQQPYPQAAPPYPQAAPYPTTAPSQQPSATGPPPPNDASGMPPPPSYDAMYQQKS